MVKITETSGTEDLVVNRLILFTRDECVQNVLDNVSMPDLTAKIDGDPVIH